MLKKLAVAAVIIEIAADAHAGNRVVTDGRFTNVYVYPDPSDESWDQHMAKLRPADASKFSRAAIDHFTETMMAPEWPSYFDALHQYDNIHPPRFFGSYAASQACVDAAMKDLKNGVMQFGSIRKLANCHVSGDDPSPQETLIFSPDIHVANYGSSSNICGSSINAYHAAWLNVPDFVVLPTEHKCMTSFDDLTEAMSHELVETLSDPAGLGKGGGLDIIDKSKEVADACADRSDRYVQWNHSVSCAGTAIRSRAIGRPSTGIACRGSIHLRALGRMSG